MSRFIFSSSNTPEDIGGIRVFLKEQSGEKCKNTRGEWVDRKDADRERKVLYDIWRKLNPNKSIPPSLNLVSLPELKEMLSEEIKKRKEDKLPKSNQKISTEKDKQIEKESEKEIDLDLEKSEKKKPKEKKETEIESKEQNKKHIDSGEKKESSEDESEEDITDKPKKPNEVINPNLTEDSFPLDLSKNPEKKKEVEKTTHNYFDDSGSSSKMLDFTKSLNLGPIVSTVATSAAEVGLGVYFIALLAACPFGGVGISLILGMTLGLYGLFEEAGTKPIRVSLKDDKRITSNLKELSKIKIVNQIPNDKNLKSLIAVAVKVKMDYDLKWSLREWGDNFIKFFHPDKDRVK